MGHRWGSGVHRAGLAGTGPSHGTGPGRDGALAAEHGTGPWHGTGPGSRARGSQAGS